MFEEEIFHQALDQSGPEERAAYVEQACAGNPVLRAAVEGLLRAYLGATGLLERPVATVHAETSADTLTGSNQTDPATGKRAHNWFFYDADDTLVNFLSSSDHKTKVK
jgi:hypothetical protein